MAEFAGVGGFTNLGVNLWAIVPTSESVMSIGANELWSLTVLTLSVTGFEASPVAELRARKGVA